MSETQHPAVSSLVEEIMQMAVANEYVPEEGLPVVDALEGYDVDLVRAVCASISDDLADGMRGEELLKVFRFVFLRAFEAVVQWGRGVGAEVPRPLDVAGMRSGDYTLAMPAQMAEALGELQVPDQVFSIFADWLERNAETVRKGEVDVWLPLALSLQLAFALGISVAVKVFSPAGEPGQDPERLS